MNITPAAAAQELLRRQQIRRAMSGYATMANTRPLLRVYEDAATCTRTTLDFTEPPMAELYRLGRAAMGANVSSNDRLAAGQMYAFCIVRLLKLPQTWPAIAYLLMCGFRMKEVAYMTGHCDSHVRRTAGKLYTRYPDFISREEISYVSKKSVFASLSESDARLAFPDVVDQVESDCPCLPVNFCLLVAGMFGSPPETIGNLLAQKLLQHDRNLVKACISRMKEYADDLSTQHRLQRLPL